MPLSGAPVNPVADISFLGRLGIWTHHTYPQQGNPRAPFQTRCMIDICSNLKQGTRVLAILTFLAQGPGMLSAGIMAVQNDP